MLHDAPWKIFEENPCGRGDAGAVAPRVSKKWRAILPVAFRRSASMPRGPKGQKRPADVIRNAVHVMRIATGEIEESGQTEDGRNEAAVELGRKGGLARAKSMSKARRAAIARKAASARWKHR